MTYRIEGLPENPLPDLPELSEAATIHPRNSAHGCLAARVERH
ncbi:MAG TPA: hypothetical protein VF589_08140 [Allosphingosinicella sp.]|jgi:hypothetical protein